MHLSRRLVIIVVHFGLPFLLSCSAFLSTSSLSPSLFVSLRPSSRQHYVSTNSVGRTIRTSSKEPLSSVDVDYDEDTQKPLGDSSIASSTNGIQVGIQINGNVVVDTDPSDSGIGFNDLLSSVGLKGKLKHASDLPLERKVSVYDIFCNRELRLDNIVAIGFDMDYTLAQYKEPAFDQLAFDGAKEKLVRKLGYPEEVLDFQYDHQVRKKSGGVCSLTDVVHADEMMVGTISILYCRV